jgi:hypothetical protein
MAALRPFMTFALKWVADNRAALATMKFEDIRKKKDDVVKYILENYGKTATAAAAAGGKAGEVKGLWL